MASAVGVVEAEAAMPDASKTCYSDNLESF